MLKLSLMTLCRKPLSPIYRLFFPAKIFGLNNVKQYTDNNKPFLLVSNHHSKHDPLQLIARIPKDIHFLAKSELFKSHFGWLFKQLSLIEVDRDHPNLVINQSSKTISEKGIVAIFPEGTTRHKKSNQLLPFKYGAIKIAMSTKTPIIPVAITGKSTFLKKTVTVRFGKPYYLPTSKNMSIATMNDDLRQKIADLMSQNGVNDIDLITGKPGRNPSKDLPTHLS